MLQTGTSDDRRGAIVAPPTSRAGLTAFLMELASDACADAYMLVETRGDGVRIVASNWMHDAIELVGRPAILALARAAAEPGAPAPAIRPGEAPQIEGLDGESCRLLDVLGHRELRPLRLPVSVRPAVLVLSADRSGAIDVDTLTRAQMRCAYAMARMSSLLCPEASGPLTGRERECLVWVAEGKTTEEVAVILGVSANTAGSYVASAIRSLAADNRPMAVATAIRSGMI